MSKTYDSIIIGAGIAGASTAHALTQKGQKVLVFDKKGIASGGSGAAGAFVSPKIGKGSPLQTLTNEAFSFSKQALFVYRKMKLMPRSFQRTSLLMKTNTKTTKKNNFKNKEYVLSLKVLTSLTRGFVMQKRYVKIYSQT